MTDELVRLANGVLWPGFLGTEAPEWLLAELREGLAGVVYFSQNVGDGLSALSDEIMRANPGALIGIDEEGGNVTRLESTAGSTLPGAAQLGIVDDVEATRDSGAELARRVAAIGANVVLGPVADVNTDPRNPVIGVRSFGSDEELVARHVQAAVEGLQGNGVAACVKHFPGHGDTHTDSHHALPEISLGLEEFERVHLEPFRAAVAAGVDAIMTAHIVVPAWGAEPATLNPRVLGILRDWGFDGVIISDALDMAAIRETVGIGQGAARALAAGVDLLCIGNPTNRGAATLPDQDRRDFLSARDGILAAVHDGSLPRERLVAAARRVARLAETLVARAATATPVDYDGSEIVRRAIRGATADAEALAVVDARRRSTLAVDSAAAYLAETLAADGHRVRVDVARTSLREQDAAVERAVLAEGLTVVLLDRPDADDAQRSLVERVAVRDPAAVVVNVGLAVQRPLPLPVVEVGSASRIGAQAARDRLTGGASRRADRASASAGPPD
jgi:beta-N-acetylhexosaminidase